jgi:hypothetical protein
MYDCWFKILLNKTVKENNNNTHYLLIDRRTYSSRVQIAKRMNEFEFEHNAILLLTIGNFLQSSSARLVTPLARFEKSMNNSQCETFTVSNFLEPAEK